MKSISQKLFEILMEISSKEEMTDFVATAIEQHRISHDDVFPIIGVVPMYGGPGMMYNVDASPTEFDVLLESYGKKKIQTIKKLRQLTPRLGLREAKMIVDDVEDRPMVIREAISKSEANTIKWELENCGSEGVKVRIEPSS